MNVLELIKLLHEQDPTAKVVIPHPDDDGYTDWDPSQVQSDEHDGAKVVRIC